MDDSIHFKDMLKERGIEPAWADLVVREPDRTEDHDDGSRRLIKQIPEYGGRWLRAIVNTTSLPEIRVPAFSDRRLRRT